MQAFLFQVEANQKESDKDFKQEKLAQKIAQSEDKKIQKISLDKSENYSQTLEEVKQVETASFENFKESFQDLSTQLASPAYQDFFDIDYQNYVVEVQTRNPNLQAKLA